MERLFEIGSGYKSYIGFIGMYLAPVVYGFYPALSNVIDLDTVVAFFTSLAGVGLAHKLKKLTE